jgi:hypothetical protein
MAGGLVHNSDGLTGAVRAGAAMRRGLALLLLLILPALAGCGNESATIRYRATAKVVVDGRLYEGSAVRETSFTDTPHSLTGFGMAVKDDGEAVAVDVGPGRNAVYILLNDRSGSKEFPFIALRCFKVDSANDPEWITALRNIPLQQKCALTPSGLDRIMPLVVAFRDEAVPKSIFEVTPESFREAFGVEARFVELELEHVNDGTALDSGIDKRLPWLNQIPFDGTKVRVLDPHAPRGTLAKNATLAQRVADYYFKD